MNEHDRRCHACSIDVHSRHRNAGKMMSAFVEYERVVEYVESLPPDTRFTVHGVWYALGRGYSLITYTKYAIRDMRLHGIIRCVRRSRNGKCLAYSKISVAGGTCNNT